MSNRSKIRYVADAVDNEGFHYAFHHYDDFNEVKDEEFHRLRKAYLDASKALADYIDVEVDS